jgi:ribosomal protein L21E
MLLKHLLEVSASMAGGMLCQRFKGFTGRIFETRSSDSRNNPFPKPE